MSNIFTIEAVLRQALISKYSDIDYKNKNVHVYKFTKNTIRGLGIFVLRLRVL